MHERWIEDYYTHRDLVLCTQPLPVRVFLGYMLHRSVLSTLHGQGTGRLTSEEIGIFRIQIWQQFEQLLRTRLREAPDGKPFWVLGSTQPTEADATLYGFIISILAAPR